MMYDELVRPLMETLEKSEKYDLSKIYRAYEMAKELHADQLRASGEPYITHPIAVAEITATLGLDTDSICAALLHDTVEDCGNRITLSQIRNQFGEEVAMLVDGLTKLVQITFEDKEEEHVENLRKMFLAMSKDVRVIFIKLCDRLHNMRTLGVKKDEKRRLTALETMHVYAPIAHRLGIQRIKQELENLALQYLDPIGYEEVKQNIDRKYGQSRDIVERAKAQVVKALEEGGIACEIEGRVKSVYSIWRKMFAQNKTFDEIYDYYAIRVIVNSELECYTVLGLIHDMFRSVPGRFKDYISTPKPNMYRSLHTTVIGRDGIPFEVQIRTYEMHHIAEFGLAAHWKYKSGAESKAQIDEKLSWIAKLLENEDDRRDSEEFLRALKIDIFHDETFVFTPKGDVVNLPQGATVIDFAYMIHTQVGNKMVGAKINGAMVPIDRVPQNGEIVEIITSNSSKGPNRDWLNIVTTGEARNKIRQWFKKERRPENIALGKTDIDREFRRFGRSFTEAQKAEILQNVSTRYGYQTVDDFYNVLGYGGLTLTKIQPRLKEEFEKIVRTAEEQTQKDGKTAEPMPIIKPKKHRVGRIVLDGVDGCEVKFAKCCNPLPGDAIIGFVTKGYGVSIHKTDCPNIMQGRTNPAYADRYIDAQWDGAGEASGEYEALLQIFVKDRFALLADLTSAFAEMKMTLTHLSTQKRDADDVLINVGLSCRDVSHLKAVIARIRQIRGVTDVVRGFS